MQYCQRTARTPIIIISIINDNINDLYFSINASLTYGPRVNTDICIVIYQTFYLFELWLSVPVNSNGHVGTLPLFCGACT